MNFAKFENDIRNQQKYPSLQIFSRFGEGCRDDQIFAETLSES